MNKSLAKLCATDHRGSPLKGGQNTGFVNSQGKNNLTCNPPAWRASLNPITVSIGHPRAACSVPRIC
jgi:hypothetical protein